MSPGPPDAGPSAAPGSGSRGRILPRRGERFIKICGVMSVDLARAAAEAGADAIGLMFAPSSPRCIGRDLALEIAASLPSHVTPVAVFQDAHVDEINAWPHEWVQLHGGEDETLIASIRAGHSVIRGFRFDEAQARRWDACPGVDALIIDGSVGGKGKAFDHARLAAMMPEISTPVILAGGLTAGNVRDAIAAVQPFGVDVSSGVERERGVKDQAMIRVFCEAVRG